jgi:probable HAF family extracellular repeat protein
MVKLARSRRISGVAEIRILMPKASLLARRLIVERLEDRCLLSYTVTDLGTLGGPWSAGFGVNNAGDVSGASQLLDHSQHAFFYRDGILADLGTLGGPASNATGINDNGQIVGSAATADGFLHAVVFEYRQVIDLGTLGGYSSVGLAISNTGQVVGYSDVAGNSTYHAVLWGIWETTDLGTLGGPRSEACGINTAGQVVGSSDVGGPATPHAFLWQDGVMTDLGTLGGDNSWATGINDAGQIIGQAHITPGAFAPFHAFSWQDGTMTDLGTLGGDYSWATGINNAGQIVGYSITDANSTHAFLFDNGTMTDLNSMVAANSGWTLDEAYAISDTGLIVGAGMIRDHYHAFLLTPDDPSSVHSLLNARDLGSAQESADRPTVLPNLFVARSDRTNSGQQATETPPSQPSRPPALSTPMPQATFQRAPKMLFEGLADPADFLGDGPGWSGLGVE